MLWIKYITGDVHAPFGSQTVYKGGGGGTTTTKSGIDEEFKPYVEKGLKLGTGLLEGQFADPSSVIASLTPQQLEALQAQESFGKQAMEGTGIYDTRAAEETALKNLAGQEILGSYGGGSLGSARSQAAMQGALAQRAGDYQKERQRLADYGMTQLGEAGTTLQKQSQAELSARDEALDRFFNRLTGVASKSTETTQSSGGGK